MPDGLSLAQQLVSIDFFTVPTIGFQVLYVFLVLAHDRTGQQLREAFPFDQLPRYLRSLAPRVHPRISFTKLEQVRELLGLRSEE